MFAGLTEDFVREIFDSEIAPFVRARMDLGNESPNQLKRTQGTFVLLRPVPWEPKYRSSECAAFRQEVVLFEHHFGGPPSKFEMPFDVVARAKAYQSFVTGLPSKKLNAEAWMYQPGWTRWGGSAVLRTDGSNVALITAYSGGTEEQDSGVAETALFAIDEACQQYFEAELDVDPKMMWVGGQPPSAEKTADSLSPIQGMDQG